MIAFAPLLAAIEDIIKVIVPIIFMIFWIVSQIMGNRPAKPAGGRGPAQPPADPRAPDQLDLRKQIETFLKQAAGGKDGVDQVEAPPRQPRRVESPVEAEVIADPVMDSRASASQATSGRLTARHEVSSHVQQHLDTHELVEHASQLGEDLGQTDERLEARLHAKFDHTLGQFQQSETSSKAGSSEATSVLAAEIIQVFRNPHEVRRALILNEILNRPEDRW